MRPYAKEQQQEGFKLRDLSSTCTPFSMADQGFASDSAAASRRRGLSPEQRRARWHFARLGAVAALAAALLLELVFGLSGAGRYFHQNAANVVLFYHRAKEQTTRENLGTGDVQLTLSWKGSADLDLHCEDPSGERIYFAHRRSASGGRLDFDMNAGAGPWSNDSVENIFWPFGSAPEGQYTVYVHAYRRNDGPDRTPFRLRVLHRGRVDWVSGEAVYQAPQVSSFSNPVNLLPPQRVYTFRIDTPPPTMIGQRAVDWAGLASVALWSALVSAALLSALLGGLNHWYQARRGRPLLTGEQLWRRVGRSILWGACYGALAQVGFAILSEGIPWAMEAWRLMAWIVLASLVGGRSGQLIPIHLPSRDGKRGGFWGGLSGGVAFACVIVSVLPSVLLESDVPARLLAALLIGGCIGWQVRLPEPAQAPAQPQDEQDLQREQAFLEAPTPPEFLLPAPIPAPEVELRVAGSRGGRSLGGQELGGPRELGGGRSVRIGRDLTGD